MRRRLFYQIYFSFILLLVISVLAISLFSTWAFRDFYYRQVSAGLKSRAFLLEPLVRERLLLAQDVQGLCQELGKSSETRITVVAPSGRVLGDSDEEPAKMENHADRPEIAQALGGNVGLHVRRSHTLKKDLAYVAVPVKSEGRIIGVVRISTPLKTMSAALREVQGWISLGVLVIILAGALTSLYLSRRISRPVEELKQTAERIAAGDFSVRMHTADILELSSLAEAMNEMAVQLDQRIGTITDQRNEQQAILSSMAEGLIAVDHDERIISINNSAVMMFGLLGKDVQGRRLQEVIRDAELYGLINKALAGQSGVEGEIVLDEPERRIIHGNAAVLRNNRQIKIGAIIVLNDITRLKQLENVRREFVANVSHELKTPITSIKGFVETLLEGAINDRDNAERFLKIISSQIDQLNVVIDDLLLLSRIEQDEEQGIKLAAGSIAEVIDAAITACSPAAEEKGIRISESVAADLQIEMNKSLLTQAVVNLIDNAIKYSEPGSVVDISMRKDDHEMAISVQDQGCGIELEHIPRIFERFYRVDKARSKKLGGTGLGLAIVKHIVQAHRGRVSVESAPSKGSTFTVHLPVA